MIITIDYLYPLSYNSACELIFWSIVMSLLSVINESFIGNNVRVYAKDGRIYEGLLIAKESTEVILADAVLIRCYDDEYFEYPIKSDSIYLDVNCMYTLHTLGKGKRKSK
jgi:small nuclear ribonucleoprotein (snRNP)-like protein